jgi:hypothetical protein
MTRESTYVAEPSRLMCGLGVNSLHRPPKGKLCSDATSATFFHEGYEVLENALLFLEFAS